MNDRESTARLRAMLLGWGAVGLAYSLGAAWHRPGFVLAESAVDQALPFSADAVWLYLSFFALVPLAYLAAPRERLQPLMRSMQLCAATCAVSFVAWPTTLAYPPVVGDEGWSAAMLALLAAADSSHNCLPSLHGALSLLAIAALWDARRPARCAALVLWGIALALSIVMLRRHLWVDLGAGMALGALAGLACTPRPERRMHWWEVVA